MAMISRSFARLNQPANAAYAAQLLSETFRKAGDCGHNISLEARLLIFKLYPLLGLKTLSLWSFGN
jgi:hypothetical protein